MKRHLIYLMIVAGVVAFIVPTATAGIDTGWDATAYYTNNVDWSSPNDDWYAPPDPALTPASTLAGGNDGLRMVTWRTPSGVVHTKWFQDSKTQKWYWNRTK